MNDWTETKRCLGETIWWRVKGWRLFPYHEDWKYPSFIGLWWGKYWKFLEKHVLWTKYEGFHPFWILEFVVPFTFYQPSAVVSTLEYEQASADPLRDCAAKIVEDMNRNHWEDIRQFCNVYAQLDLMVSGPTNIIHPSGCICHCGLG